MPQSFYRHQYENISCQHSHSRNAIFLFQERRAEKKLNTQAFKVEMAIQEKVKANQVALAGIKIY